MGDGPPGRLSILRWVRGGRSWLGQHGVLTLDQGKLPVVQQVQQPEMGRYGVRE